MTAAPVPPAAEASADSVVTVCGVAFPPPVVVVTPMPETAAHPTSALAAGGVEQLEVAPPAPPVPLWPAAPAPAVRPGRGARPVPRVPPLLVVPPVPGLPPLPPASTPIAEP